MKIGPFEFLETCSMCPEQYNVIDGEQRLVGYVRVRWGVCEASRASSPPLTREQAWHCFVDGVATIDHDNPIYEEMVGDDLLGCFDTHEERVLHLTKIAEILTKGLPQ